MSLQTSAERNIRCYCGHIRYCHVGDVGKCLACPCYKFVEEGSPAITIEAKVKEKEEANLMDKGNLIKKYQELDRMATKLVELGEDENSLLFKQASSLGDFIIKVTEYVDTGHLSMKTGLKMINYFYEIQSSIYLKRMDELMNKNNCS